MKYSQWMKKVLITVLLVIFTACSGGGGATPDNTPPTFTSPATASVTENQTEAIMLVATDAYTVTYSISGTDAASFYINSTSGVVTFKSAPDFESGKTNYTFTAEATDTANNTATQSVTITILDDNCMNGDEVWHLGIMYCPVSSPYTHKVWLDRNVGALKVCDRSIAEFADDRSQTAEEKYTTDQQDCFGVYYQWGRDTDGHEQKESNSTAELADNVDDVGHSDFITSDSDWAADTVDNNGSMRVTNWSKTNGTTVCPTSYRVPTIAELSAELFDENSSEIQKDNSEKSSNSDDRRVNAYKMFLKLPASGYRKNDSGTLRIQGEFGFLWQASQMDNLAWFIRFAEDFSSDTSIYRANGFPVRCLKNDP